MAPPPVRTLPCMQGLVSGLVLVAVLVAVAAAAVLAAVRLHAASGRRGPAGGG